jgi:hypothetical protein
MRHTLATLLMFAAVVVGIGGVADALASAHLEQPAPTVVLDTTDRADETGARAAIAAYNAAQVDQ